MCSTEVFEAYKRWRTGYYLQPRLYHLPVVAPIEAHTQLCQSIGSARQSRPYCFNGTGSRLLLGAYRGAFLGCGLEGRVVPLGSLGLPWRRHSLVGRGDGSGVSAANTGNVLVLRVAQDKRFGYATVGRATLFILSQFV